ALETRIAAAAIAREQIVNERCRRQYERPQIEVVRRVWSRGLEAISAEEEVEVAAEAVQ
ncbi:hypothetical protein HDU89_001346, partial [Geranomyces variabilis]